MSVATTSSYCHLDSTEPRWFAIYTRFKCEKCVAEHLKEKGIQVYLPLQTVKRQYTRKVKTHHLPLISCYVFVKITRKEYVSVLETDNVVSFVQFRNRLVAIPEAEITILRRVAMESEALMDIQQGVEDFAIGDQVEIIAGSLTGLKGRLVSHAGNKCVIIELEQLGYTLRLKIGPEMLHKLATPVAQLA